MLNETMSTTLVVDYLTKVRKFQLITTVESETAVAHALLITLQR